jgi:type II secretory pathway pseudopilin PulG
MLIGQIEEERRISLLPQSSPVKKKGTTLVEVLIVTIILVAVFFILLLVLNSGYISNSINLTKIQAQEEARRVMDWIVNDIRQTTAAEIKSNSPTSSYLKFRVYDNYTSGNPVWSSGNITYTYNDGINRLTRLDENTGVTVYFDNITQAPFGVDASWISGSDNNLTVTIDTQRNARGSLINYNLTTEVRIRNE